MTVDGVGSGDDEAVVDYVVEHSDNSRSLVKMFRPLFKIMHVDLDKARRKHGLYQVRILVAWCV